jgi:hypothetical protein
MASDKCVQVISYTLRDIKDEESYMESMGQARTSEVLRDARIGLSCLFFTSRIYIFNRLL